VIQKRGKRDLPPINENIRFPEVRVIDGDGTQLGLMSPREGRVLAEERSVDLVLVSDKANPPVCRLMDYGKYRFEQEKRAREAKKRQHSASVKEVKMRNRMATDLREVAEVQQAPKQEGRNMMMFLSPKK